MRHAPPVIVLVGRSRFGAAASGCVWLLGLAVLVAWAWTVASARGAQGLMAVLLLACGAWAWHSVRQSPTGLLDWDGSTWSWETAHQVCDVQVQVACDLQRWLLVRMVRRDGLDIRWLWLASTGDDRHWLSVRRALYSRGASQAPPEQPAAMP